MKAIINITNIKFDDKKQILIGVFRKIEATDMIELTSWIGDTPLEVTISKYDGVLDEEQAQRNKEDAERYAQLREELIKRPDLHHLIKNTTKKVS